MNDQVDGYVEGLARRTAARTTRRSFLGKLGRVAVVVAGGSTMATLLGQGVAQARVCGQSGVSPLCPTFDCTATWGWCWYARGCCADGALKKICDCCAPNTRNPVGYCPPGTRVLCVVESCGADPRLQAKTTDTLPERDAMRLSVAFSREAFPGTVPIAVIGDAESVGHAAVAASLGRVVEGPVLLTDRSGLAAEVADELARLRVEFAKVVGPLAPDIEQALSTQGIEVERVGTSAGLAPLSAEVGIWSRSLTGTRRAIAVVPGVPDAVVAGAAAAALMHRLPLLVGPAEAVGSAFDLPRSLTETFVVSSDPADARRYPGGRPVTGDTPELLAQAVATLMLDLGGGPDVTLLADSTDPQPLPALALAGAPVLLHGPETLDGARDWLFANRPAILRARLTASPSEALRREVQSLLNEFEVHLLRGVGGEGLPVIPQPFEERPIGLARR